MDEAAVMHTLTQASIPGRNAVPYPLLAIFRSPGCAASMPLLTMQSNVQFVAEGFITGIMTLMCGLSGILLVHVSHSAPPRSSRCPVV